MILSLKFHVVWCNSKTYQFFIYDICKKQYEKWSWVRILHPISSPLLILPTREKTVGMNVTRLRDHVHGVDLTASVAPKRLAGATLPTVVTATSEERQPINVQQNQVRYLIIICPVVLVPMFSMNLDLFHHCFTWSFHL